MFAVWNGLSPHFVFVIEYKAYLCTRFDLKIYNDIRKCIFVHHQVREIFSLELLGKLDSILYIHYMRTCPMFSTSVDFFPVLYSIFSLRGLQESCSFFQKKNRRDDMMSTTHYEMLWFYSGTVGKNKNCEISGVVVYAAFISKITFPGSVFEHISQFAKAPHSRNFNSCW